MYDATTPILGAGTVAAEAITAWFNHLAPGYRGYAPNGQVQAVPSDLGRAIVTECQRYPQVVNWDVVAAQVLHETAAWQSRYARERNNPGGIGAINSDPDQALTFATVGQGVRAHVAHLLSYAVGNGPWAADDRRYQALVDAGWLGAALAWGDLNGRWAWPGTAYGAQITTLANELVAFANDGGWGDGMAGDDARFEWVPDRYEFGYPNPGVHGRSGKSVDYLIIHVTEGTDSLGWLRDRNGSSSHYLTHRDATPRAQLIREADAAWTAGSRDYNERGINLEFERFKVDPWTDAEYRKAAATAHPILKRHNLPIAYLGRDSIGKRGMLGHEDVPDGNGGWGGSDHHSDPGPQFDFGRFVAELTALDASPSSPDMWVIPGNRFGAFGFVLGFRAAVETLARAKFPSDLNAGALSITGYPKENEWRGEDGRTYQRCERATLIYDPTAVGPWDVVLALPDTVPERAAA